MKPNLLKLTISILIAQLAGFIGSLFTSPSIPTWYAILTKPTFNPPNWLFAPVWVSLYFLMAVSAYLVWNRSLEKTGVKIALIFYAIQLVLNSFWSIIFFGLRQPFYAFLEIIILWLFIFLTILSFWKISKPAALLLLPYISWVTFAALLNFSLWQLNR